MDSIAAIELTELHGLFTDPQVRHYLCDDQVIGLDRVQSIIEGSITHFRESGLGLWTVSGGVTAERAGIVGFAEFSAPGALELMYAFYPHFWGRGLATETARAVMQRGFTAGLREIRASTDEPNQASIAVLQRLGFRKTGRQEATPPHDNLATIVFCGRRTVGNMKALFAQPTLYSSSLFLPLAVSDSPSRPWRSRWAAARISGSKSGR